MEVYYKTCSKSILFTLLTVLLLTCARGESDDASQDEPIMPVDALSDVNATALPTTSFVQLNFTTAPVTRWRRFTPRRPTTRPPWRRYTTRRPTSRPQNRCPFDCEKACVVPRRTFFRRSYVCIITIHRGCQLCCRIYAHCRLLNIPDWICYQNALDCVCRYRTRYRNIRCSRRRCYKK